ncbi:ubiquitin protein [Diplodia corticola]|uniref:Ubiquitin protein n=1 Tax=Diplodia corticola TaxID=236234 RepID=A0A1J9RB14_9PEZI|nr:ubiquitin protein [Diplodia corticola]OJD37744.1 ubiquitin protein [Diplodia corticola]
MASSPPRRGSRASADAPAQPASNEAGPPHSSVEMSTLTPQPAPEHDSSIPPPASTPNATPQDADVKLDEPQQPSPEPALVRSETEAIGPASDTPAAKPDPASGPQVVITLLLTSGARHPYKIDEKYLRKRNVTVENMDPFNISVYTLKELIWRDWREEWEPRPSSPSAIRLISFGRMLDDKQPLKDCRFQAESPNVVHMTVKPQEVVDEEDAKTAKTGSRDHDDGETTARCRCVIL